VATYLERDVCTISNVGDLASFQRFVELCAGRTAQLLIYSGLASDCGISQPSAKAWLSILETSFVAFRLPAFHSNLRKRLVKMPKLHFYESGLVCWLLGIRAPEQLRSHPLRGAIFESWVVSEVYKHRVNPDETRGLSFCRDRDAAEADLVIEHPDRSTLVEVKAAQTASSSLFDGVDRVRRHLDALSRPGEAIVVYGGDEAQHRTAVKLVPWARLHESTWGA
jgi:predicted AAA+ superfamily ATPase